MVRFDFSKKSNIIYEILVYLFMIAIIAFMIFGYIALLKLFIFIIIHF